MVYCQFPKFKKKEQYSSWVTSKSSRVRMYGCEIPESQRICHHDLISIILNCLIIFINDITLTLRNSLGILETKLDISLLFYYHGLFLLKKNRLSNLCIFQPWIQCLLFNWLTFIFFNTWMYFWTCDGEMKLSSEIWTCLCPLVISITLFL